MLPPLLALLQDLAVHGALSGILCGFSFSKVALLQLSTIVLPKETWLLIQFPFPLPLPLPFSLSYSYIYEGQ